MTLGEIIKTYRKEHGMSMDAFAEKSGISKAYISLLEKNKHPKTGNSIAPSIAIIQSAAKAMNMDFDFLFSQLTGSVSVSEPNPLPAYEALEHALKGSGAALQEDAEGNTWLTLSDGHTIDLQNIVTISKRHSSPNNISKIMQYFNTLNDLGKREAEKRVEELTYIPQYTLKVQAAHNDYENNPEEHEKMMFDLDNLKRPE